MIDLSKAPYNIVPDWTPGGGDAAATDWTNALEDAIGYANMNISSNPIDSGGAQGDLLMLPNHGGGIMISRPLPALNNGTILDGGSAVGCVIKVKDTTDPTKPVFTLGDQAVYSNSGRPDGRVSSFGCALRNMTIIDKAPGDRAYGVPVVYTDNGQDTLDMLSYLRIYTTRMIGVKAEKGIGGASFVHMRHIETTLYKNDGIGVLVDYGESCQVMMEMMEPAHLTNNGVPLPGSVGLYVKGGRVTCRGFHVENCQRGIYVALQTVKSKFRLIGATGGNGSLSVVTIDGSAPYNTGRIKLEDVHRNGSTHVVEDGRSGKNPVDVDIDEPMVF